MTERCKSNPCCGDYFNCKRPPQFLPREGYEAYQRRLGRPAFPWSARQCHTAERVHLQWNEGWHTWQEVLPQYARERGVVTFIRSDLVSDAVKALEEARERIQLWADIASDATQTRHDPSDDLAPIDAALARIKGDVT